MSNKKSFWKMDMWAWGILVVCITLVSWITYDYMHRNKIKQENITMTAPVTEITITAQQYAQQYKINEISADKFYRGKLLSVAGTVSKIGRDTDGAPYLALHIDEGDDVFCYVRDEKQVLNLQPGDQIKFVGVGGGKSITGPLIFDEQLVKKK